MTPGEAWHLRSCLAGELGRVRALLSHQGGEALLLQQGATQQFPAPNL